MSWFYLHSFIVNNFLICSPLLMRFSACYKVVYYPIFEYDFLPVCFAMLYIKRAIYQSCSFRVAKKQ